MKRALQLAKQTTGLDDLSKRDLQDRLLFYKSIYIVPSDVDSGSSEDEPPELVVVPNTSDSEDDSQDSDSESGDDDTTTVKSTTSDTTLRKRKRGKKKCGKEQTEKDSDVGEDGDEDSESEYTPTPKKKIKKKTTKNKKHASKRKSKRKTSGTTASAAVAEVITSPVPAGHTSNLLAKEQQLAEHNSGASGKSNGVNKKRGTTASKKTKKRKTKKTGKQKEKKHHAKWNRVHTPVEPYPRALPELTWRSKAPPRTYTATPWATFRKIFFTDELLTFATEEFNHYPQTLRAMRARPSYIPEGREWPPKWVSDEGRDGPMRLTKRQYLKYILILYLLGAKGLNNANLDTLFSTCPCLGEPWLRSITNGRDFGRFLRQV